MKKVSVIALMIISAGITIYTVMFWQPSDNSRAVNKIDTALNDEIKNADIGKSRAEENSNKREKSNMDEDIEVALENDIFKVEESEVKKLLTKDEKKRIDVIIKKMSSVDLNNLKENLSNENKSEGFKEGFALIRTRSSVKEYEELKEILSEYIDFDILEVEV